MRARHRWRHAACSVAGRRTDNEDRAATTAVGRDCLIAVVADGMGGANAGAVASEAAVRGFLEQARGCTPGSERRVLRDAFAGSDAAIRSAAQPGREGMGTTLVAAIVRGEDVWVGNIGDSRAVLVLPDEVIPLSADHSVVGEALRAGEITEVEALHHPYRHAVSRAMGDGDARPDLRFHSLREHGLEAAEAVVLLGSDGLFNHLGDAELLDVVATRPDVRAVVHELVLRAIRNGSDDNVTAAALLVRPERRSRALRAAALLAALMLLALALWMARPAEAQHVESIDGEAIVLSVGAGDGVRKGMTGKLCTPEVVNAKVIENCSAQFVVIGTSQKRATIRITKGVGRDARAGYLAKFDRKLIPPETEKPPKPPKSTEDPADRAFREADRAFRDGDWRGALERYQSILDRYPRHPKVDLAAARAENCRTSLEKIGLAQAVVQQAPVAAPVSAPPVLALPATAVEAEELAGAAEQLLQNGELAKARQAAEEALRMDSTNPRAHAIHRTISTKSVASRFHRPSDVAVTANGWCYVADSGNNTIRKIAGGSTTTAAGLAGQHGTADGPVVRARFNEPTGLAVGSDGAVFVADRYNASIRRIGPDGRVQTTSGRNGSAADVDGDAATGRFREPRRLAVDRDGTLYIADTANHAVRKVMPTGEVATLFRASGADRMDPLGIAVRADGRVLVADAWSHVIREIDRHGTMRVLAGVRGSSGSIDGAMASARFNAPEGVAIASDGTIYVADSGNHTIRRILNGVVSTVAGRAGVSGFSDGIAAAARFNDPSAVAVDARGNVWIADRGNQTIRMVADGFVSTVAGLAGEAGSSDGAN